VICHCWLFTLAFLRSLDREIGTVQVEHQPRSIDLEIETTLFGRDYVPFLLFRAILG